LGYCKDRRFNLEGIQQVLVARAVSEPEYTLKENYLESSLSLLCDSELGTELHKVAPDYAQDESYKADSDF
jgi:hypothetical protein